MAFDLTCSFTGPCVYVPLQEKTDGTAKSFMVLMANATEPGQDPQLQRKIHVPVLIFPEAALANKEQVREHYVPFMDPEPAGQNPERLGAAFLTYRDVELSGNGLATTLTIHRNGRQAGPQKPVDPTSFDWLPKMDEAVPGSGEINATALNPSPPPEEIHDILISRFRANGGRAEAASLSASPNGLVKWQFPPGSTEDFLALGAAVVQRVNALQVTLKVRGFRSTVQSFDLIFKPSGSLELKFRNLEPHLIFGPRRPSDSLATDNDFAYLYRLSANQTAVATTDLPVPERPDGPINDGSETCGGSQGGG